MTKVVDRLQTVFAWMRSAARSRSILCRPVVREKPRVLVIMAEGPGREALQGVFRETGWTLVIADTPSSALALQQINPLPIILYERELTERGWRQVVSIFSRLSPRPCVVLLSRSADKNLWDELVRCGGFDLLRLPVEREAVIRTVGAGWSIWQSQHQPRRLNVGARQEMTPLRTA